MSDRPRLPTGFSLIALDRVGSTNDEAKARAAGGAPDGTILWAREQTAGRGRQGRPFASPPGNLYCSLVLRPQSPVMKAAQLGMVAAVALADAIATLLPSLVAIEQKWPNDVLLNGRKASGILLESSALKPGQVDWLVLGVGVNVATHPDGTEFPATDLRAEGAAPGLDAIDVLERFAGRFAARRRQWRGGSWAEIRQDWLARAWQRGRPIRARLERETLHGVFADLDAEGALLLDLASGERRRITAADMFPTSG